MLKRIALSLLLAMPFLAGCPSATAPTPPTAPGYINSFDQTAAQTLAAAHALVAKAIADYPSLTASQQATEKPVLNAFVSAVNTADSVYLAYHNGTASQLAVQTQLDAVTKAQTSYTSQAVR